MLSEKTLTEYLQVANRFGYDFRFVTPEDEAAMNAIAAWCGGRYEWEKAVIWLPCGLSAGSGDMIFRDKEGLTVNGPVYFVDDIQRLIPDGMQIFPDFVWHQEDSGESPDWIIVLPDGRLASVLASEPDDQHDEEWSLLQFLRGYAFATGASV